MASIFSGECISADKILNNRSFLSNLLRDIFFLSLDSKNNNYFPQRIKEYNELLNKKNRINGKYSNFDNLYDAFESHFYDKIINFDRNTEISTVNMEKLDDFIKFIRRVTNIDLPGPMRILRLNIEKDIGIYSDGESDNESISEDESELDTTVNFVNLKPYYADYSYDYFLENGYKKVHIKDFVNYSNISNYILIDTIKTMDFVRLLREWTGTMLSTPGVYPSQTWIDCSNNKHTTLV